MGAGGRKSAFAFLIMKKTIIYIDGFNLYYSLKNTAFKWINPQKLSYCYLNSKQHQIKQIKYFTAKVKRKSEDSSNVTRQKYIFKGCPNNTRIRSDFWSI